MFHLLSDWITVKLGTKPKPIVSDMTPDLPESFGYKMAWYAIKCETPLSIIDKLELELV